MQMRKCRIRTHTFVCVLVTNPQYRRPRFWITFTQMTNSTQHDFTLNAWLTCERDVLLFDPVVDRLPSDVLDRAYFAPEFGRVRAAVMLANPNDLGPRFGFLVFYVSAHSDHVAKLCGGIVERVKGIEPSSLAWETCGPN